MFPKGIWHLWLRHNTCVFRMGVADSKPVEKCRLSAAEFFAVGMRTKLNISKTLIAVAWRKPPLGWTKLNIDGSALGCPGKASGGGLIRDHNRDWVTGFARSLGYTNSFLAELWALRDGLTLAKELNLNSLIVKLDAKSVVQFMNNNSINMLMEPLLIDYRTLPQAIPNKRIEHTYRKADQCADALARIGARHNFTFVVFVEPPHLVESLLACDKANTFCYRLVAYNI